MAMNYDQLFHTRIVFEGRERQVELRVPRYGELFALILEPQHRTPERTSVMFPAEFKRLIKSIDGEPPSIEQARALYANAQAAGEIVAARNRLYETLSEQGRVFAQCPNCLNWEAEVSILALTTALQAGPWPIVDQRMYLAVPALGQHLPRTVRSRTVSGPASIRFELPSKIVGLPAPVSFGIIGNADRNDGSLEMAAWDRWVNAEPNKPGREQWRDDIPGFRAALRLAVALERLDRFPGEITPEIVLEMPAVDFYFLDNLHYLAYNADVPDQTRITVNCERCKQPFGLVS
jgi:hypothetical protein